MALRKRLFRPWNLFSLIFHHFISEGKQANGYNITDQTEFVEIT